MSAPFSYRSVSVPILLLNSFFIQNMVLVCLSAPYPVFSLSVQLISIIIFILVTIGHCNQFISNNDLGIFTISIGKIAYSNIRVCVVMFMVFVCVSLLCLLYKSFSFYVWVTLSW